MSVSGVDGGASALAQAKLQQEVSFTVLKKAMDIAGDGAMQLLEAARPAANLPAHLGSNINTTA